MKFTFVVGGVLYLSHTDEMGLYTNNDDRALSFGFDGAVDQGLCRESWES